MSYIDGFVIPVPTENRQKFIDHAKLADSVFTECGALRVIECWADDVPDGKTTDFRKAVKAETDETVVFSWVEWPDKATRDAAMEKLTTMMETDDRFNPEKNPMPFDGKRLIFGGFEPVVDLPSPATPSLQPYLFFRGRCEEAIGYYREKLGAEVLVMMRFSDNPDTAGAGEMPDGLGEKIMHASLRINGSDIMMSDGMKSGPLDFQCMSLTLSVRDAAEADRMFDALAEEGSVEMPMAETFFSPRFGAVTDKFGVSWMVIVDAGQGGG